MVGSTACTSTRATNNLESVSHERSEKKRGWMNLKKREHLDLEHIRYNSRAVVSILLLTFVIRILSRDDSKLVGYSGNLI